MLPDWQGGATRLEILGATRVNTDVTRLKRVVRYQNGIHRATGLQTHATGLEVESYYWSRHS